MTKPFLKWAGSKRQLVNEILIRLPAGKIRTYYEPFVGGGSVFFALAAEKRFKHAVLGDINSELIDTYLALVDEPDAVIRRLLEHTEQHGKSYYYAVRASSPRSPAARAARMIYLNKTCFNGLYRVNRKGEFNVPFGDYKNPTICDAENLRAVSAVLRDGVDLFPVDFEELVRDTKRGDFVYFDSPYWPVSKTANFTAYSKGGFGEAEQIRLRNVAKRLTGRGVSVMLSNADTPEVRELYKGFRIDEVKVRRAINSNGAKRGRVGELIIRNYS